MGKRIKNVTDDPRALTEFERGKITQALGERVPQPPNCDFCGKNVWALNNRLVTPLMVFIDPEAEQLTQDLSVMHPCVLLQCTHCGNSKFLSLNLLGVGDLSDGEDA